MGSGRGKRKVRILIIDDHPLVRERLREVIDSEPDLKVCGEADEHQAGLQLAQIEKPDLMVIDLSLRGSQGLDLIKDVHARHPSFAMLVLSMHEESLYAERVIRAGARGYITKQEASRKVLQAIRTVLAGNVYLSQNQMASLTAKLSGRLRGQAALGIEALTDRELDVFELLGSGLSTRSIANQLGLDMRTVETYRARIKQKLDLRDGSELLQHAIRWVESGGVSEIRARQRLGKAGPLAS